MNSYNSKHCGYCNKKLKLTDITCRCGIRFCPEHRYSDKHLCTFDYKEFGKNILLKENPIINSSKLEKI